MAVASHLPPSRRARERSADTVHVLELGVSIRQAWWWGVHVTAENSGTGHRCYSSTGPSLTNLVLGRAFQACSDANYGQE